MEIAEYKVFAENCFRDTPPPCAAVCPLAYDVREFIKLMQRGSVRSAYRIYRNGVLFPQIISRICPEYCKAACVRGKREGDRSVELRALEMAAAAKMAGKKPERFAIPKKTETVSVVGGGLSGLAAAYRLSSFGYNVTVFEKEDTLGGSIREAIGTDFCNEELMLEFSAVDCSFSMHTEVREIPEKQDHAWYIAIGRDGQDFEEKRPDIFRGGAMTGADPAEALAQGMRAATAIDAYFKTGKAEFTAENAERKADERYYALHYSYPEESESGNGAAKGEPEAQRCLRCNCSECYDVCPLMEKEKYYPRKICAEITSTLKPNMSKRTGVRIIMGCADCGKCKEACPEKIDMGKCLGSARSDFYESGAMAPAFHDYWLCDMDFSLSEEAALVMKKDPEKPCDIVFFPGCQLGASSPAYTEAAFEALAGGAENAGLILGCCGVPAKWAGQTKKAEEIAEKIREEWEKLGRPLFLTACPTCQKNLSDILGKEQVRSVYCYFAEHLPSGKEIAAAEKVPVRVMDPCSSAEDPETQAAVRKLLADAGYAVENETPKAGCCGFGGHIYSAVPELARTFAKRQISGGDGILAAYCANCRDVYASEGADARHVLGLVLGIPEEKRKAPDLDGRRENRRILKRHFTGEEAAAPSPDDDPRRILIPQEIIDKMNRELVLRETVEDTIRTGIREKTCVLDEEDGICYTHKKQGIFTVWAAFSEEDDAIRVTNVYVHRVEIQEDA